MKKYISITIISLLSTICLLRPTISYAQTIGLSINPPIYEATIKPGKNVTQVFTIQNLSTNPKTVTARIIPFVSEDDTGIPTIRPDLKPDWLAFFTLANSKIKLGEPFTLNSKQSEQLILNLTIPPKTAETDIYATLVVATDLDESQKNQNSFTAVTTTVGSNLLITVSNKLFPSTVMRLTTFEPDPKDILFRYGQYYLADNLNPIKFKAVLENAGRHLTKTAGLFRVSKGDQAVLLTPLIPLNIISGSQRILQASPSGEIVFKPDLTTFGLYEARIDLRSENGSASNAVNVYFFPFKLSLGIILGLSLITTSLRFKSKSST